MNSRRTTTVIARAGQYALLAAFVVFLAFPLVWMLSTSLKGPQELVALNPSLIPQAPTLDNFVRALTEQDLVQAAINSAIVSFVSAILTVAVALPAAYTLIRFPGKLQKVAVAWILVSQVFPMILIVIPLFLTGEVVRRAATPASVLGAAAAAVVAVAGLAVPLRLGLLVSIAAGLAVALTASREER